MCNGKRVDVRPNWKEQPTGESLTGKQWPWSSTVKKLRINVLLRADVRAIETRMMARHTTLLSVPGHRRCCLQAREFRLLRMMKSW
jgi:hypothetical protein